MGYYLVKCKFGHVGRDQYLPIEIPIEANSIKEASLRARNVGGVKRDHKDWCLDGPREVSYTEYQEALFAYKNDVYFEKHSRSRLYLFKDRLKPELHYTRSNGLKTNKITYKKIKEKDTIDFHRRKEEVILSSLLNEQRKELSQMYFHTKLV